MSPDAHFRCPLSGIVRFASPERFPGLFRAENPYEFNMVFDDDDQNLYEFI